MPLLPAIQNEFQGESEQTANHQTRKNFNATFENDCRLAVLARPFLLIVHRFLTGSCGSLNHSHATRFEYRRLQKLACMPRTNPAIQARYTQSETLFQLLDKSGLRHLSKLDASYLSEAFLATCFESLTRTSYPRIVFPKWSLPTNVAGCKLTATQRLPWRISASW
jgi:hypothetical protein